MERNCWESVITCFSSYLWSCWTHYLDKVNRIQLLWGVIYIFLVTLMMKLNWYGFLILWIFLEFNCVLFLTVAGLLQSNHSSPVFPTSPWSSFRLRWINAAAVDQYVVAFLINQKKIGFSFNTAGVYLRPSHVEGVTSFFSLIQNEWPFCIYIDIQ